MDHALWLELPGGLTCRVSGVVAGYEPLLLQAYLPGVQFGTAPANPADLELILQPGMPSTLQDSGATVVLGGLWQQFPMDAYHLLYGMVRRTLLARGYLIAHAACLGGILLASHSGAGKSTASLHLRQQTGWPLLAGNKTVLAMDGQGFTAVAGTRAVTLETTDTARFENILGAGQTYASRKVFTLTGTAKETAIRAMVLMRLNDGATVCRRLTPASALHTFYPLLIDAVNADVIVGDGAGVLPGAPATPGPALSLLAQQLADACQHTPAYVIAGSLDFVCESIRGL